MAFALSGIDSRDSLVSLPTNLIGILDADTDWLLWLTDFDIWSTEIEEIGWALMEALVQSKLELNSSAFLFGADEKVKLKAAIVIPLLFDWDALLIRDDGKTFVTIDHDHQVAISTVDESIANEIKASQLQPWIKSSDL